MLLANATELSKQYVVYVMLSVGKTAYLDEKTD